MSQRLKVLLVIPTLDQSGAEKQLTLLATGLPRDAFDVHVFALTRGGPYAETLQAAGIPVTVFGKRFKFDPGVLRRLKRAILDLQPDVVHPWLFAANAYVRLALGRHPAIPIIVSERCVDTWKSRWQLWLDRFLIPRTARLVGNSTPVVEYYRAQGFPADRSLAIPNGMPVPPSLSPEERTQARTAALSGLGLDPSAFVVGYVGRLAPQKRVDDLIWAFELLRIIQPQTALLIVGEGPERTRLEKFCVQIKLMDQVRFLGHRADAASWLPLLDAFWLASDFEGQSNSLMEAMACGLPCVVSDIAPNRELITDNETGFVVPMGDRAAFTKATQRLMLEPELAARLGAAARAKIETEFSVSKMVERYAEMYRRVVRR